MSKKLFRMLLTLFMLTSNLYSQNIDSLKLALKNAKHDTIKSNTLMALIEAGDNDSASSIYYDELIKLAESNLRNKKISKTDFTFYHKVLAIVFNNLGFSFQQHGNYTGALPYFNRSLSEYEKIGAKEGIAISLNNIGFVYDKVGDIAKALVYYQRSLKIHEGIGNKIGIASTLSNIGIVYENQGNITKALDFWVKCLQIQEEVKDKGGKAYTLNNIGFVYETQGEILKALEYYNKALKILEQINDEQAIAYLHCRFGSIYHTRSETFKALEEYKTSLKIFEQIEDKQGISYTLNHIGGVYDKLGDMKMALSNYKKCLMLSEEIGDKQGRASSLINIGGIYFKQGNYPKALEFCKRSIELSLKLGFPEEIRNAAEKLFLIYKANNNYKLAFENYKLFIQMRDSINNIETQKAAIKQEAQYEFDKANELESERHKAELSLQKEKSDAFKRKQNAIILSVSIVLLLVALFSSLLYNRFKTTQKQKQIIEVKERETQHQKNIIEEKQKEILDSINYAKRIQYTLLAHDNFLKENLQQYFTYFNPKDIVSGDFYWATKQGNKFYLAVCDSTGHGVPGAFMSLLNIGFLSEAINEKGISEPNKVFDFVRQKLTDSISKEGQKDGFDGILLCLDGETKQLTYAAANNAPILIQNNQVIELPSNRMPVGIGERKENFTLHTIDANPGDIIYLYTDGYPDQFGGPKGKKFKYKALNELLLANHKLSMQKQYEVLKSNFNSWKGKLEQIDDVCVIGFRV